MKDTAIEMTGVDSSTISSIGYDEETKTLAIAYVGGGLYRYFDVSKQLYKALMGAKSIGSLVSQTIKGFYKYIKMD